MTKLSELQTDLAGHVARLKEIKKPETVEYYKKYKKRDITWCYASYERIIKSLKAEIKKLKK